ncbi:hypothetical protein ABIG06_007338 [Bradyrhizobium sp. USDA 326]|uniref:hypothetical protein n=1 Tax=unclassified Bradyrhizobium TaxID=2631580 RepID=UPI00351611D8
MLKSALNHLLTNVIPAAQDYHRAETELSAAFDQNSEPAHWTVAGQHAKRRAAEVALAIDGLADRAASDLGISPEEVRKAVAALCVIDGAARPGSIERVCAVANAYKHAGPLRGKHPIASESDILAAGAGFGIDGYGIGKFGGVEILVTDRDGTVRKFLGDVPWAIAGWFRFLVGRAALPREEYRVCGLCVKAADPAAPADGSER